MDLLPEIQSVNVNLSSLKGNVQDPFLKDVSFAQVVKNSVSLDESPILAPASVPRKRGEYVAIRVDRIAYKERLKLCSQSLIGRIILSKGDEPWKLPLLKEKLQSIWKLTSQWRLISLGRGFFQILLSTEIDKAKVWGIGALSLKPGVLRLQPWVPNFNPNTQRSTNAQIWVRIYDLPWEFWHKQILSDLARGIGVPLKFDASTLDSDFGHFARILIDVDLSKPLVESLMVEIDDDDCLFASLFYENVPNFCAICSCIGHTSTNCRHATLNKNKEAKIVEKEKEKKILPERGRIVRKKQVVEEKEENCIHKKNRLSVWQAQHPIGKYNLETSVEGVEIDPILGSKESSFEIGNKALEMEEMTNLSPKGNDKNGTNLENNPSKLDEDVPVEIAIQMLQIALNPPTKQLEVDGDTTNFAKEKARNADIDENPWQKVSSRRTKKKPLVLPDRVTKSILLKSSSRFAPKDIGA